MKQIGTNWDRNNRNTINENFTEAEKKVLEQKSRVDRLIQDSPQPSEVVDARGEHAVLGDRLNEFTAQLAQIPNQPYITEKATKTELTQAVAPKADQNYVEYEISTVNSRVDGIDRGYGGTYATLTDLQNAFPTGDTKRHVVSADGNWYYWNGTTWVSGGIFQPTGIAEKSVDTLKLTDGALKILSSAENEIAKSQDINRLNELKGVNEGNTSFYRDPTTLSVSYVDNDTSIDVNKMIRLNYADGTNWFGVGQTSSYTEGDVLPVWGAWFKKSDLVALEGRGIYTGIRANSVTYRSAVVLSADLIKVGYIGTYTTNGVTIEISILAEHDGLIYIQGRAITLISGITSYHPIWAVSNFTSTGKLDIINYTLIKSNNNMLPYHVYPETEAEFTLNSKELTNKANKVDELEFVAEQTSTTNDRTIFETDYNKINQIPGFNDGYSAVLKGSTSQVDPVFLENDSFMNVKKMLRFYYTDGNIDNISINKSDVTYAVGDKLPVWGAWFRKSDIENLGAVKFYSGIASSQLTSGLARSTIIPSADLKVGKRFTNTEEGTTIDVEVKEEFEGWLYIQARVTNMNPVITSYRPMWAVSMSGGSGQIDIVNFTLILTNKDIIRGYIYPRTLEQIPFTQRELTDKVKALETEVGAGEFVGTTGNMIGDSIVAEPAVYAYVPFIRDYLGMDSLDNHGIAGRGMADTVQGDGGNKFGKVFDGVTIDYTTKDLTLIAMGTNDFKLNVPLGTLGQIGDTGFDTTTFYGAYRELIEYILTQNPQNNIVLFTPLQRNNDGYDVNTVNTAGHKLVDYVDAILEIGAMYSIPVYDVYRNSGVTEKTLATYTYDGLHLGEVGYKMVGTKMSKFIKNNVTIM